jgi:succinate-acetate transporter protein
MTQMMTESNYLCEWDSRRQEWSSGGVPALYLIGVLLLSIFFYAIGPNQASLAPELGLWILATAIPLLILGIIDMRRGDTVFGTLGMVFGGLLGLGAGLAFVRPIFLPGPPTMDGYWFLGTSIVILMLIPSAVKKSKLFAFGLIDAGIAVLLLGLTLIGSLGQQGWSIEVVGYLALLFCVICFYSATARITNETYGRSILPLR